MSLVPSKKKRPFLYDALKKPNPILYRPQRKGCLFMLGLDILFKVAFILLRGKSPHYLTKAIKIWVSLATDIEFMGPHTFVCIRKQTELCFAAYLSYSSHSVYK